MKIALSQMQVVPLAIERNLETIKRNVVQAKNDGCDLIVFPELCVGGYLISDKHLDRHFCRELMLVNEEIRALSQDISIVYGNVYEDASISERLEKNSHYCNKDGRTRLYNAAYIMHQGHFAKRRVKQAYLPDGVQPKTLLPSYRFFDDPRYFFSLQDVAADFGITVKTLCQPFEINTSANQYQIGLEVCEDLWCKDYRQNFSSLNVTRHLIENGSDMIVNVSASPWTHRKNQARDRRIHFLQQELQDNNIPFVPYFYVNNVGAQNNGKNIITFDGDSSHYNAKGELVNIAKGAFKEELLEVEAFKSSTAVQRETPDKMAEKYQAIITGLQHVQDLLGWQTPPKFLVGLSGGVDSAVVVALLCKAFGAENVMAVNMPSQYNSQQTQSVAQHISDALGIDYRQVPISELVDAHQKVFAQLDEHYPSPDWMRTLSDENIQAKIRGTSILSNIAGRYGRMFTNNGNKVEIALGYATLYGDVGGVIAPIGDLTKAEVFDMARYLNQQIFQSEVIPHSLLPDDLFRFPEEGIAPSAELRDAQIDPMKFGYHCAMLEKATSFQKAGPEDILIWYLNGELHSQLDIRPALLERWGMNEPEAFVADLEWFYECIRKSVFKRIQSPPIILTSPSAYGFDIRESQIPAWQGKHYQQLKAQVLALDCYPEN
ncbi:MAG: NAD(+) synthase [Aestuariibacter sp.]